jgi:hypothetical protein
VIVAVCISPSQLLAENDVDAPTKTTKAISVAQLQRFSGNMLRFGVPLDHVNTLLNKFAQFVGLTKPELDVRILSLKTSVVFRRYSFPPSDAFGLG